MARTRRPLKEFIEEYMLTKGEGDLDKYITKKQVEYFAKTGIRDMSRTLGGTPKTVLITPNAVGFVEFPKDYLEYTKIGYLDQDNEIRTLGRNDNLNPRNVFLFDNFGNNLLDGDGIELIGQTADGKTRLNGGENWQQNVYWNVDSSQMFGHHLGRQGGTNMRGYYRVMDDGIELSSDVSGDVILEYIADETMRANPMINDFLEEPLRSWIYYQYIRKKAGVAENAKIYARRTHFAERRVAKMKARKFTLEELVQNGRKATVKLTAKA